ncbi:MAG: hypothetical protein WC307_00170 [Candidatus Nanoarchaeia archaeon]
MNDLILQIITTLCLIIGIITGETISNKLFGYTKKWYLNIIEIFLFITLLITLFNNLYLQEINPIMMLTINFFFGLTAITITRAITSGAGFLSKRTKERATSKKEVTDDVILIGLTRNLFNKGLSKEEITNLLENSGFKTRKVKKVIKNLEITARGTVGTNGN